jgi:2-polyprenyl-3-methyl-5-hydroxy-6-metoxy-1,4-benzoquinol methylase
METLENWKNKAQLYEISYWRGKGIKDYSDDKYFNSYWFNIFEWIGGFMPSYEEEVLDIGSGPRPVLQRGFVIEPLANEYRKIAKEEWWKNIEEFIPGPGEEEILSYENKFDFILCWNAIDHSYEPLKILQNIKNYLKDEGIVVIATDCKMVKDSDHPVLGIEKDNFIKEVEKDFNILLRQDNFSERDLCLILQKKLV